MRDAKVWQQEAGRRWLLGLAGIALVALFFPGLSFLVQTWRTVAEYGFGFFVPFIVAFLVWEQRDALGRHAGAGDWSGLTLIAVALLLNLLGQYSAIRLFGQYGFVIAVFGLSVCHVGWRGTRVIAWPLAFLFLMVPMPQFALRELSEQLQLLSSELGVAIIRAFHISVFLEGNVIDLGSYQLQVADACSGLRYLLPLMTLGILVAYFFQGAAWKRAVLVVSTVPLTIAINSLRIGLIGVTVEHWGGRMADGLLHDFEGWFMFMVCIALLAIEMAVLARIGGGPRGPWFGVQGKAVSVAAVVPARPLPRPLMAALGLLAAAALVALAAPTRDAQAPARAAFAGFPLDLHGWSGQRVSIDGEVLDALQVDDHLIADYRRAQEPPINFYVAWYATQSGGESAHSPRTCMPGGGWQIAELDERLVDASADPAQPRPLRVNRAVIQRGEARQLVWFWFDQRGRDLTNEYAVKWYILRDALVRHRTDGALVRLVTPMAPGDEGAADRRLRAFAGAAVPALAAYVPR